MSPGTEPAGPTPEQERAADRERRSVLDRLAGLFPEPARERNEVLSSGSPSEGTCSVQVGWDGTEVTEIRFRWVTPREAEAILRAWSAARGAPTEESSDAH